MFKAIGSLFGLYILSKIISRIRKNIQYKKMIEVARRKVQARDDQIKKLKLPKLDLDPKFKEEIIRSDAQTQLKLLREGKVTSVQLTTLYIERAMSIGRDLEIITEINFEEALEDAKRCDELRKTDPSKCRGELFGLPMSVKDCFNIKGKDSTIGCLANVNKPFPDDGLMVKVLKSEGAIIFVKTNVPQLMMAAESFNRVFGRAKNPWNIDRSPGGSSGGESAALSSGISPLGMGSDIGGSGRLPGTFTGTTCFKPNVDTIIHEGSFGTSHLRGNLGMRVCYCPMGKTVDDINLIMKTLMNNDFLKNAGPNTRNAYQYKRKWEEDIVFDKKPMVIGYIKSHDFFPACKAMQRSVEETIQALEKRGHTLIPVEFPNWVDLCYMWFQNLSFGGVDNLFGRNLLAEPPLPDYKDTVMAAMVPSFLRPLVGKVFKLIGEKRKSRITENISPLSGKEVLDFYNKMNEERRKFLAVWEEKKIEILITPACANPAFKHSTMGKMNLAMNYTFIFNVLNMPAGTVPISVIKDGEDNYTKELCPIQDSYFRAEQNNLEGSKGLPVGVQVVALPHQEEKAVKIMKQIEEEIQFSKKHPLPMKNI